MKPILVAGHGGMFGGVYQTAGKRSPKWHSGTLYEGMFNRWVLHEIVRKLDLLGIEYYVISDEYKDISLPTMALRADRVYESDKNTYVLNIHANAGGGTGIEGFTTVGVTRSDAIGEVFLRNLENDLPSEKLRADYSDGDRDKEVDFYMLRKVKAPSFLIECGFMDYKPDYYNLWDKAYLDKITDSLVCSIEELYGKVAQRS